MIGWYKAIWNCELTTAEVSCRLRAGLFTTVYACRRILCKTGLLGPKKLSKPCVATTSSSMAFNSAFVFGYVDTCDGEEYVNYVHL